jgi:rubrerythrin
MNEPFTIQEIVEIAIEIEKNGEIFYRALSESSSTATLRDLFKYLSGEEKKHKIRFEEILKSVGGYQISEIYYADEYMGYMKALADEQVFKKGVSAIDVAKSVKSPKDAIEIAIDFEKDSIIFLHEMQDIINEDEKDTVKKLLNEERDHIRRLSAFVEKTALI